MSPAPSTVDQYLEANKGHFSGTLTNEGRATLIALKEFLGGGDGEGEETVNAVPVDSVGSGQPYGATKFVLAYYGSTNNIHTITYYRGATVVATRTLTYAGGGMADNDKLTMSEDL